MHVIAGCGAHVAAAQQRFGQGKILLASSPSMFFSSPCTMSHRQPRQFGQGDVVGDILAGMIAMRLQDVGIDEIPAASGPGKDLLAARWSSAHPHPCRRKRVGDRQHRQGAVGAALPARLITAPITRRETSGRAASWIRTKSGASARQRFQPQPHRFLAGRPADDRRGQVQSRQRRRRTDRLLSRPDHDLDARRRGRARRPPPSGAASVCRPGVHTVWAGSARRARLFRRQQ